MALKDNSHNSAGKGWAEGSLKGASVGFTAGGPWGALIGAALGGTRGAITGFVQHKKRSEAADMVDSMEANRLQSLMQTRRSIEAGTDPASMNAKAENARLNSSTQNVISRNSAGNTAATINGFLRAQSNSQKNVNQIEANSRQQVPFYMNAEGDLTQRMAQRRLELSLLKQSKNEAQDAQNQTDSNVNANAIGGMLGGAFGNQGGGETGAEKGGGDGSSTNFAATLSKLFNKNKGDKNQVSNGVLDAGNGGSSFSGGRVDIPQGSLFDSGGQMIMKK
tara:strand:- start:19539 stop:20372 length:834 start_codon:yes stop_codon:yes gene_type:complete